MIEYFENMHEIFLNYDTDIEFENGDIKLTSGNDCIQREIYKLLITQPKDWKKYPTIGCSPNKFTGFPNNRETSSKITAYLTEGLIATLYPIKPSIRCIPTNYDKILIFIDIVHTQNIIDTITLEFDYKLGLIYKPTDVTDTIYADKQYESIAYNDGLRTNKYWDKLRKIT